MSEPSPWAQKKAEAVVHSQRLTEHGWPVRLIHKIAVLLDQVTEEAVSNPAYFAVPCPACAAKDATLAELRAALRHVPDEAINTIGDQDFPTGFCEHCHLSLADDIHDDLPASPAAPALAKLTPAPPADGGTRCSA